MNTRVAPFDNVKVRQALNYATDRAAIIKAWGGPQVATPTCQILPPDFPGYEAYCPYTTNPGDGKWHGPDMAKAQQLIAESGTKGQKVAVICTPDEASKAVCLYFVSLLKQLGYDSSIKVLSAAVEYPYVQDSSNKAQISFSYWYPDYPSGADWFDVVVGCNGFHPNSTASANLSEFCDPTIQKMTEKAIQTSVTDQAAANQMWSAGRQGHDRPGAMGVAVPSQAHRLRVGARRQLHLRPQRAGGRHPDRPSLGEVALHRCRPSEGSSTRSTRSRTRRPRAGSPVAARGRWPVTSWCETGWRWRRWRCSWGSWWCRSWAPFYADHIAHTDPFTSQLTATTVINGKKVEVLQQGGGVLKLGETPIGPTWQRNYFLGADSQGRDVAARVLYGGRTSLTIGIGSAVICSLLAIIVGMVAGFYGGVTDSIISRGLDVVWAFPVYLLAISIATVLLTQGLTIGPFSISASSLWLPTLIIAVIYVPYVARPVRGAVLSVREKEFIEAAIAQGASNRRLIFNEILPNVITVLIVLLPLMIATTILTESALSYLSIGVQPPNASWGTIIDDGQQLLYTRPWVAIAPGIMIVLTVLSLNVLGDGVRDALDPRAKLRIKD